MILVIWIIKILIPTRAKNLFKKLKLRVFLINKLDRKNYWLKKVINLKKMR